MNRIADDVVTENRIADTFRVGRQRNRAAHGRERGDMLQSLKEFVTDSLGRVRIVLGDELSQPTKIRDRILRIEKSHWNVIRQPQAVISRPRRPNSPATDAHRRRPRPAR